MKKSYQNSKEYVLSNSQISSLMYWAHIGVSSDIAKKYKKEYPLRMTPYDKLISIGDSVGWYTR